MTIPSITETDYLTDLPTPAYACMQQYKRQTRNCFIQQNVSKNTMQHWYSSALKQALQENLADAMRFNGCPDSDTVSMAWFKILFNPFYNNPKKIEQTESNIKSRNVFFQTLKNVHKPRQVYDTNFNFLLTLIAHRAGEGTNHIETGVQNSYPYISATIK